MSGHRKRAGWVSFVPLRCPKLWVVPVCVTRWRWRAAWVSPLGRKPPFVFLQAGQSPHGGWEGCCLGSHCLDTGSGSVFKFPVSSVGEAHAVPRKRVMALGKRWHV